MFISLQRYGSRSNNTTSSSAFLSARAVPIAVPKLPPPNITTLSVASIGLRAFACRLLNDLLHRMSVSQLSCIWLRSAGGYSARPAVPNSCLVPAAAEPAAPAAAAVGLPLLLLLLLLGTVLLLVELLGLLLAVLLLVMIGLVKLMGLLGLLGLAALVLACLLLRRRSTFWGSMPA